MGKINNQNNIQKTVHARIADKSNNFDYDDIINNNSLTAKEKEKLVQYRKKDIDNKIDTWKNGQMGKHIGLAAAETVAIAAPYRKAAKFGADKAVKLLGERVAKQKARGVGAGLATGATSGAVIFGTEAIREGKNPLTESAKGAVLMGLGGTLAGSSGVRLDAMFIANKNKVGNLSKFNNMQRKKFYENTNKYIQGYIPKEIINKNGDIIEMTSKGANEMLNKNPDVAKHIDKFEKDLRNAQRVADLPNLKPEQKPGVSYFQVYHGKLGDHLVEVNKYDGKLRYYVTKNTPKNLSENKSFLEKAKEVLYGRKNK